MSFDFSVPLTYVGSNVLMSVNVVSALSPPSPTLELELTSGDIVLAGGNTVGGAVVNSGGIGLPSSGGNTQDLELLIHNSFVPPSSVSPGEIDVIVLEFELFGGANLELIDELVFSVAGNVFDITMAELYDIGGSPYLVASANTFDGDMDGVPAFIDEDDMNAGIYDNGNLMMRGFPLFESYASSSNIYELKVSFSSNMMTGGNVEFSLDPYGLLLAGGNMASGNFVSSGPISVTGGGNGYDLNIVTTGFSLQSAFLQM